MRKIAAALLFILIIQSVSGQDKPNALALYRGGRYYEAIEVCKSELLDMPGNMDSYVVMGWSYLALGQYDNVISNGLKARQIKRWDNRVLETMGQGYYYKGQYAEALGYFQEAVAILNPTASYWMSRAYFFMGETYLMLEEYHHADMSFLTALDLSPNNAYWWSRLGFSREKSGAMYLSLDAYNKALQLDPNQNDARIGAQRVNLAING